MRSMILRTATGQCRILIGESLGNLASYAEPGRSLIVADSNIAAAVHDELPGWRIIPLPAGEQSKSLEIIGDLYQKFLGLQLDRHSTLIACGGGAVCDAAGFAAATYMRGLELVLVPSTLLAQVDAATGGKNGVNFAGIKNLIGTTRQPGLVLCDPALLKSLPEPEIRNGAAEIIKHAIIASPDLFNALGIHSAKLLSLDPEFLEQIVHESLQIKTEIVRADEQESGLRMKLNYGHTIGHALEACTGLSHGEAISVGMACEARIAVRKGLLAASEPERIRQLLQEYGLPTELTASGGEIMRAIAHDKKRSAGSICMALPAAIGDCTLTDMSLRELENELKNLCKHW